MALIECAECDKQVSSKAESCPNCGAKPPKKTSLFTWVAGGLFTYFVWSAVSASLSSSPNTNSGPTRPDKTAEQLAAESAAKAEKEATFQKTLFAAAAIKKAMRDPDSLTWESIRSNDDASVICLEYRARNGFGGMNREFAVLANGKASQKPAAWNKHCTQPLKDMKHVKYGLK